jgi:hypothetical protein
MHLNEKNPLTTTLAMVLLGGCTSTPSVSAKDIVKKFSSISEAITLLKQANGDHLAFVSAKQMKEAQHVYDTAL